MSPRVGPMCPQMLERIRSSAPWILAYWILVFGIWNLITNPTQNVGKLAVADESLGQRNILNAHLVT